MPQRARAGLVFALALVAAGCADSGGQDRSGSNGAVTVASCGRDLSFDRAPERAVALDQGATEMLLELGLEDRMVGTAHLVTDIAPRYREAYEQVPVLSPDILTGEQLREATPDVTVASFAALYSRDRAGTREELAELGLPSYVSAVDCPEDNEAGLTPFDRLFVDYENLGRIFGVEDRAAELIAEQRQVVEEAEETRETVTDPPTVVWLYSVFNGLPYVAGNGGIPSDISQRLGVVNAFDDVDEQWPEVTWEEIAERDPDLLVIGDLSERGAPGDSAEEKLTMLRDHPVVSRLDAVRETRIIEVPGIEMDPSVRSVNTLRLVAEGLRDLGYAG
ncbi:ABC transporter substrate-binding protein [Streptomyces specialis]|uniref:ABC transporter substrate-binding protein n=1 Tax=Streptomyces specialis TaxID=498367 RepID=UPI00073F29AB|nr:ABC transporter substrate-binding protein [Streptomyces specialis]